jgi:CRP-like cAMP-binding protein
MAWCEERLLQRHTADPARKTDEAEETLPLVARQMVQILEAENIPQTEQEDKHAAILTMISYFDEIELDAGVQFINQGQPADHLYFLAEGQSTAGLKMPDGSFVRLETMGSGRIIGEIGFFLGGERTADVVTNEPSTLFCLERSDLALMQQEDPRAASLLHRLVANILSERATRLTSSIMALER